jgi:hypothetical protein
VIRNAISVTLHYQLDRLPVFVVALRRYTTSCRDTPGRFTNLATKEPLMLANDQMMPNRVGRIA